MSLRWRPVVIVEYDPHWPLLYEEEKARVLAVGEEKVLAVEHVGSTAVPGLGAKPIVDFQVGVRDKADADELISVFAGIGYTHVTPNPGHDEWFYCLGDEIIAGVRRFHLHLVKYLSSSWRLRIAFRDYLRAHPQTAQEYYRLKVELATRFGSDRMAYVEAKTEFIEGVLRKTGV